MDAKSRPPPVLLGARVFAYALLDRSVAYSGHSSLFVDGKEVGRVPRLVICKADDGETLLLHCNRVWSVIGVAGYPSVVAAKQRAERIYRGVKNRWVRVNVTKVQAERYLRRLWAGKECSFCGRRPDQLEWMISRRRARICDRCVTEFHDVHARLGASGRGA